MSVGTQIAGYRLEEEIGRGGMGVVYRAHDVALERSVALKLLSPSLAQDRDFRERFLVESRLAAALEHPNVVPVHDAGEAEGQLYLAMRYVEGTDLKRLLKEEGKLEPERAIAISSQVAEALDAAHARGLVHRDVKPSNVLLDEQEHAYLADFGLTRRLSEQAPGFDSGLSLGTPAYVAPEQIEGKEVDGRADQYSLGCLLCECLSGKPPFPRGSEAATLFAHLEEEPPAPPGLESVLPRALAKHPDDRYESCSAFLSAARTALGLEPKRARWPLAVAGVGAALVGAALLAFFLTRGGGPETVEAAGRLVHIDPSGGVTETIAMGTEPSAVAISPGKVWVADRATKMVSRIDSSTGLIERQAPSHGTPSDLAVRGWGPVLTHGPLEPGAVSFSTGTGAEEDSVALTNTTLSIGSPRVAARGEELWVAAGDRRVGRLSFVTGELQEPSLLPSAADEADWFPSAIAADHTAVWVAGDPNDRNLWRLDPRTGKPTATIPLPAAPTDLATGLGRVWVTSHLQDVVVVVDPKTNRVIDTIRVGRGADAVAVGAGSVWVANAIDGTVSRVDPETLDVETIDVEGSPTDLAVGDSGVWVTTVPPPPAADAEKVAIGVIASCEGAWGTNAETSFAGAELPLIQRGARLAGTKASDGVRDARVAGRDVELYLECGDDSAQTALAKARRLVEQTGVDILIGSTETREAFAIREYARRRPEITFLNGTAYSQALTLKGAAPNYFRFMLDGAQWMGGLGAHAYHELGWRTAVTIGDDWVGGYLATAGFAAEFCSLGGTIVEQVWTPLGAKDLSAYVARVPRRGVDGFLMAGLPSTSLAFFDGLPRLRKRLGQQVVGTPFLYPLADSGAPVGDVVAADGLGAEPRASRYLADFRRVFPDLAPLAWDIWPIYFYNPMEGVLQALESVGGDLSDDQKRFRAALAKVELDAPQGHLRLDGRRQAIGPAHLVKFRKPASGPPVVHAVRRVEGVEQTFNGYFSPDDPPLGRDTIECKRGNPPPWARR